MAKENQYLVAYMKKDWKSGVYGFFDEPKVEVHEGQHVHVFKCNGHGCKLKDGIRRYIDTKDTGSTGNLHKHVKACWGADILQTANKATDAGEVHNVMDWFSFSYLICESYPTVV